MSLVTLSHCSNSSCWKAICHRETIFSDLTFNNSRGHPALHAWHFVCLCVRAFLYTSVCGLAGNVLLLQDDSRQRLWLKNRSEEYFPLILSNALRSPTKQLASLQKTKCHYF